MMWWSENSGYGMGWVSWILMALAMIAFWGLVIAALLALFRPRRSTRSELRGTNAQHLLDERYARGEIDDDGAGFLAHANHYLCSAYACEDNFRVSLPDSFARNDLVCSIFGNYGEDLIVLMVTLAINLSIMGVSVLRRMVVPRFAASILVGIALTGVVMFVGFLASYLFNVYFQNGAPGSFVATFASFTKTDDMVVAMIKAVIYGAIVGIETFGASAPYQRLYKEYGITAERVCEVVTGLIG